MSSMTTGLLLPLFSVKRIFSSSLGICLHSTVYPWVCNLMQLRYPINNGIVVQNYTYKILVIEDCSKDNRALYYRRQQRRMN